MDATYEIETLTTKVPDPRHSKPWRTAAARVATRTTEQQRLLAALADAQAQRRQADGVWRDLPEDATLVRRRDALRAVDLALEAERRAADAVKAYVPEGDEPTERTAVEDVVRKTAVALAAENQRVGERVRQLSQALVSEAAALYASTVVDRAYFSGGGHPFVAGEMPGIRAYLPEDARLYPALDPQIVIALEAWLVRTGAKVLS